MPIVKTVQQKVVFDRLYIDTTTGSATVYFSKYIDDIKVGPDIIKECGPALVVPLLMSPAAHPELSRSFDIALAVYDLAMQQGWFEGEIV